MLFHFLLKEIRGIREELKSEICELCQSMDRRLAQNEEKINSILAMLPLRPNSETSAPRTLSASMRAELIRQLPFLTEFQVFDSPTVPFVVDNLEKPVLAQRFPETTRVDHMFPPTVIWANESFCTLVNTPLYELLGRVSQGGERLETETLLPYIISRSSALSSDIIWVSRKWPKKDGGTLVLRTRNQIFYNKHGWAKWLLMVADTVEEAQNSLTASLIQPPYRCPTHSPLAHTCIELNSGWTPPNEKEPFFSAFPSCFSALPFPPPLWPPSEAESTSTIPVGQTENYSGCHHHTASTRGRSSTKQGRGESEMDELLSALIPPSITDWDGEEAA